MTTCKRIICMSLLAHLFACQSRGRQTSDDARLFSSTPSGQYVLDGDDCREAYGLSLVADRVEKTKDGNYHFAISLDNSLKEERSCQYRVHVADERDGELLQVLSSLGRDIVVPAQAKSMRLPIPDLQAGQVRGTLDTTARLTLMCRIAGKDKGWGPAFALLMPNGGKSAEDLQSCNAPAGALSSHPSPAAETPVAVASPRSPLSGANSSSGAVLDFAADGDGYAAGFHYTHPANAPAITCGLKLFLDFQRGSDESALLLINETSLRLESGREQTRKFRADASELGAGYRPSGLRLFRKCEGEAQSTLIASRRL